MSSVSWQNVVMGLCLLAIGSATAISAQGFFQPTALPTAKSQSPNPAQQTAVWTFAVSGDSRNCGDVIMPAIAAAVTKSGASFYWDLGDFRAIYNFDEDIQHQPEHIAKPLSIIAYEETAWKDFISNQLMPFGSLPVYLAIGNHEVIPPMTRDEYLIQFADWLEAPRLRAQRLSDDPHNFDLHTYYHWIEGGVDFITLDNVSPDEFDRDQIAWFEKTLSASAANPEVKAMVVGMHEPLPESISENHSMNQWPNGVETGHRVYADLLKARSASNKHIYVLASHSHYFMDGIFNTDYWKSHEGVLPGWIVGTAGAQRYALPKEASAARASQTDVYGYLAGTVKPDGEIEFAFQRIDESDIPAPVVNRYTGEFVHWCFAQNSATH